MVADYPTFEMALNDIKVLLEQNIRWVRTNQQKVGEYNVLSLYIVSVFSKTIARDPSLPSDFDF